MNDIEVRLLQGEERFDADVISTVCFHGKIQDPETRKKEAAAETREDWGAFSADGTLMAHIINNKFESRLDGSLVKNGGIGAVSTLPEYRESGAIRHIFGKLLPEAYKNGEVISTLYPFNHAFYRKFGYDTLVHRNTYEFPPEVLRGCRFTGTAELWKTGDPVRPYTDLYTEFISGINLAIRRDDEAMLRHLKGVYYQDRKFCYLLSDEEGPAAYVIWQDIRHDPQAVLSVEDLAFSGRRGFQAVLGFLARFTADYGTIRLSLPTGIELLSLIRSPMAYDIKKSVSQNYMIRVVNVKKLLEAIRKPDGAEFVIRVDGDELIPENNGTFWVSGGTVEDTDEAPDLAVSGRALGQMAAGGMDLSEAMLRQDVEVCSNEAVLRQVFTRKSLMIEDYF